MADNGIPHEGRFLAALGVNPENALLNTTRLEWQGGVPVLTFTASYVLNPRTLAGALLAAAQEPAQTEDTGLVEALAEQEGEEGDDT